MLVDDTLAVINSPQIVAYLEQRPTRVVWRGERIEWMLARGFHEWFFAEIRAGRIGWPRR